MSFFNSNTMDKLGSRLASFVSSASEKVMEAAERTLTKETPLEKNLREAVSDKNWGCATSILSEIARASHNYADYVQISKTMWDAIAEPPKKWRKIFKGLTMLEYMLKNGSEKFAEEARDKSYLLRMLQNFNWSEEGRDKGAGIREKAEICSTLVFDAAELKAAREVAAKNRDKYIGISSASSMAYRGGVGKGASSLSSFESSRHHQQSEPSIGSRSMRGDQGSTRVGGLSHNATFERKEKHRAGGSSSKRAGKKSDCASPTSTKPSAEKSPAQQADLLGFDSSPQPQDAAGGSSFASGNVWADFTSAPAASSGAPAASTFASFVPPPPTAGVGGGPTSAPADMGGDDIFGGFQAAKLPATSGAAGTGTSLDAVAAAFASPPQPRTGMTAGSPAVGGGLIMSSVGSVNGSHPNPTAQQQPQWQQQFVMGSNNNSSTLQQQPTTLANNNSSNPQQQPFSMGSSNSSAAQQHFSMGNSTNAVQQPFTLSTSSIQHQQPFSMGNISPQQPQQLAFSIGSGVPHSQSSLPMSGTSAQAWQQQQPTSAAAFSSLDQGLF